jgi:3-deoxy-D-arabino-heptulosonate 7-phosphate (DAHP) synthase class II
MIKVKEILERVLSELTSGSTPVLTFEEAVEVVEKLNPHKVKGIVLNYLLTMCLNNVDMCLHSLFINILSLIDEVLKKDKDNFMPDISEKIMMHIDTYNKKPI